MVKERLAERSKFHFKFITFLNIFKHIYIQRIYHTAYIQRQRYNSKEAIV